MKSDVIYGVGFLVDGGVDTYERISNLAKAAHEFFLANDLYKDPAVMARKEVNHDFEIYLSDFNELGRKLIQKGWFNYMARFERNRYADPFDTRVLMKYLKKHSEQPST